MRREGRREKKEGEAAIIDGERGNEGEGRECGKYELVGEGKLLVCVVEEGTK